MVQYESQEGMAFWVYITLWSSVVFGIGFSVWLIWYLHSVVGLFP